MSFKCWIIGTMVSALMAGILLPILVNTSYPPIMVQVATVGAAAIGIRPIDLLKILTVLMALHYASELPSWMIKIKTAYRTKSGWLAKLVWSVGIALPHFAVRIAVPVCFCLVVEGGQHLLTGSAALAA